MEAWADRETTQQQPGPPEQDLLRPGGSAVVVIFAGESASTIAGTIIASTLLKKVGGSNLAFLPSSFLSNQSFPYLAENTFLKDPPLFSP